METIRANARTRTLHIRLTGPNEKDVGSELVSVPYCQYGVPSKTDWCRACGTYSEQQVAVMRLQPHPALTTKKSWSCEYFRMVTGDILLQMLYLVVVIHNNMIVEVVGNVSLTVSGLNSTLH